MLRVTFTPSILARKPRSSLPLWELQEEHLKTVKINYINFNKPDCFGFGFTGDLLIHRWSIDYLD